MTKKELENLRGDNAEDVFSSTKKPSQMTFKQIHDSGFNEATALLWPRLVALSEAMKLAECGVMLGKVDGVDAPVFIHDPSCYKCKALKEHGVSDE